MSEERRRHQTERMVANEIAKRSKTPWWKSGWALFVGIVTLASAYIMVYPRPTLTASDNRNSQMPLDIIVTLGNNSNWVPLEKVKVLLNIDHLVTIDHNEFAYGVMDDDVRWAAENLDLDAHLEIDLGRLDRAINLKPTDIITKAEITVTVLYQPWFIPWGKKKEFRFVGDNQSDGTFRMMERPSN
jgi:hypothetical protein